MSDAQQPERRHEAADEEEAVAFDDFPDDEEGEVPQEDPEGRSFDEEPDN